ncbi:MAG: ABC transporter ATP-binding protein/permease [Saccharofermentans sp.]|nr:ABC transporter ATP-binding protein/permease [Saccharofermentans sp.]
MKTVLRYFGSYKFKSICAPLFKFLEVIFELIVPLIIASIIDNGINTGDTTMIKKNVVLLVLMSVLGFISTLIAQYFAASASVGITSDIRMDLFHKIHRLSISDVEQVGPSNLITEMTSDLNQIQAGINITLRLLLRSPCVVFGATIMAFTINVKLALIFVGIIIVLGTFVGFNIASSIPAYKTSREGLDELVKATTNGLNGVKVIRSFNKSKDDFDAFSNKSNKLEYMQIVAAKISALLNPTSFMLINLAICLLIYNGSLKVSAGDLTQGQVVALYNYMSQILVELIKFANMIVSLSRAIACASRVEYVFNLSDEKLDGYEELLASDYAYSVEFKDVTFTYKGNSEPSLNHISLKIEPGQTVGVIGRTGSGKSTLASLIAGIYKPDSGQILINGIDVNSISRDSFYKNVGFCMQKARIFTGSISDNVKAFREDVSNDSVDYAIEKSCSTDIINRKERGKYYKVSSNGSGLSGGQKQRIGIARSLASKPSVLIMDDCTSALDAKTETNLLNNLKTLDKNPTRIMIAQKIRTVKDSDYILLLEEGRLIASAPHKELIKTSESYRYLCALQKEAYNGV